MTVIQGFGGKKLQKKTYQRCTSQYAADRLVKENYSFAMYSMSSTNLVE